MLEEIYSLTYLNASCLLFDCCILLLLCSISEMKWETQFDDMMLGQCCIISLDGTEFCIQEPSPFNPMWYSHNFKGSSVWYRWGYACEWGEWFGRMVLFLVWIIP